MTQKEKNSAWRVLRATERVLRATERVRLKSSPHRLDVGRMIVKMNTLSEIFIHYK